MINIKTKKQIKIMHKGGKMLSEALWEVVGSLKPGMTEADVDKIAENVILAKGGEPGFKRVQGYKHTICISTNDICVHGIPGQYKLRTGDVVGIDCGVFYDGFHTDMSETVYLKPEKSNSIEKDLIIEKFLSVGKSALNAGIKQAVVGNHIGNISKVIQDIVEVENGYSIVRSLVGHGVGKELHEEPEVPGYLYGKIEKTPILREGMVIAIEIIYNMGSEELELDSDGWTLRTKDGSLSGLFERTVAITQKGPLVLTP